jgi:hypothetical protein
LAVVGFLFKLTKNDNPALDLILKAVKSNPSELGKILYLKNYQLKLIFYLKKR